MTIEEAGKKWCCQAMGVDAAIYCQGDKCMAWRWKLRISPKYANPTLEQSEEGYCGLAGEPKEGK
jgi:hypothetical protein